jgi:hypothetical protein
VPTRRLASATYGEKIMAVPLWRRGGLLNYSANLHALYFRQDSRGWLAPRKANYR